MRRSNSRSVQSPGSESTISVKVSARAMGAEAYPPALVSLGEMLVDRSEMGKLALTGPDAKSFLNGQVTNDVEALEPGTGCYAAFLTHKGKMLGDLRILDTGEELLLICERVALQGLFDLIRRFKIRFDCELHKRTVERGLLSLVGDDAALVDAPAQEHASAWTEVAGARVLAVRT